MPPEHERLLGAAQLKERSMARTLRLIVPGQPVHVVHRGNNRSTLFHDRADFDVCMWYLRRASIRERCAVHAYALMGNHVHLLMTPETKSGLPRMMQSVGLSYARYFNHEHAHVGTVWQGRYRSKPIGSAAYFFACSRYIELNPVRANIAGHPGDYLWSSFRHNACGEPDSLVTNHSLYRELGRLDGDRRERYLSLFATSLDADVLAAIRHPIPTVNSSRDVERPKPKRRRRASMWAHGGDRRSEAFRTQAIDSDPTKVR